MAALRQDVDYDFDMFDVRDRGVANAAPAVAPERRRPPLQKVPDVSRQEQRGEERRSMLNTAIILLFAAVILSVLCLQISAGAKSYEVSRQIAAAEAQLSVAKSENVRLNSELNAITNIGRVDSYATKVLGMRKVESYQVEYVDLSQEDSVIYTAEGGLADIFGKP